MFDAIQAISNYSGTAAVAVDDRQKVEEQFLAIFYKEILKQTFKAPNFSLNKDEDRSLSRVFSSDLMVEQMAIELAKNGAFSARDIMHLGSQKVEQ